MENISDLELDALREIMNTGAVHASVVMSEMAKKKIEITFPVVKLCRIEDIPSIIGKPHEIVVCIYLPLNGENDGKFQMGSLLHILSQEGAIKLASILQSIEKRETFELSEMDISALKEVTNVMSGSCLKAISEYVNLKLIEGVPHFACDMQQSIVDHVLVDLASKTDKSLVFKTLFNVEDLNLETHLIIVLYPDAMKLFLERLRSSGII